MESEGSLFRRGIRPTPGGCRWIACWSVLMFFWTLIFTGSASAQGGPPFRTDDPETPGNRHWEINFGWIGERNPGSGAYQVPDFDFNYGLGDRVQLKYEIPIAIEETRALGPSSGSPQPGQVIGGLGQSLLGIKWRFYERYSGGPWVKGRFGTGLLGAFGHHDASVLAGGSGDSPGAASSPEGKVSFSVSTYPQMFLDNPTRAVPQSWGRGLLVGHEFGDRTEAYVELYDQQDANRIGPGLGVGQFATGLPKQRETTVGLGGRQALNRGGTLNLLLMGGRSFQTVTPANS